MPVKIRLTFMMIGWAALATTGWSQPAATPIPSPSQSQSQGLNRRVNHTEAYKAHPERGPHIDLKITPPEKRGKDTMVLIEVYNRAKVKISILKFDITLKNHGAQDVSASIDAEDLSAGWSVPRWVKIPGTGKLPTIDSVIIDNVKVIDVTAKEVKLKVYSDLIKE